MQITKNEKTVLLYFACILLVGNSVLLLKAQSPNALPELFPRQEKKVEATASTPQLLPHSIDLATASDSLLQQLPGIGPAFAQRIIEYRKQYGFRQIEDLKKIRGIGPKKFDKLKTYLYISEAVLPQSENLENVSIETSERRHAAQTNADVQLICLNSASETELCQLLGIGPAKAKRIVEFREANGPFSSLDDLTLVSGVGAKTLENIRPYLTLKDDKK